MTDFEQTLEERFRKPPGWTTGSFENAATGHRLFYGYAQAANPKAIVVILGGLSEFSQKYYELARDMLARNYSVWTMDWAYQGQSSRLPETPQRRHSDGFDADALDLHKFVTEFVRPSTPLPVILVAHSMGSLPALLAIIKHQGLFDAAALSAPMLGIPIAPWQRIVLRVLSCLKFMDKMYVPTMGKDWNNKRRAGNGKEMFSSDPARDSLHPLWSLREPGLQIGDPTIKWIAESFKSFAYIEQPGVLEAIQIPVMIAVAGLDQIVINDAVIRASKRIPKAAPPLILNGANHEILMESDQYRQAFLSGFDKFLEQNKIVPA